MKKILALLLALTMAVGMIGCSDVGVIGGSDGPTSIILDSSSSASSEEEADASQEVSSDTESSSAVISSGAESSSLPESQQVESSEVSSQVSSEEELIDEYGWYYSKEDVALYIYTYGHLPENFITKNEARDLGWNGGSVERYAPGYAIGGDKFGNREGLLPKASGRVYYECDIDTDGADSRGAKRIVFSNDGLIYYTDDHYESFELLYGEE